MAYARNTTSLSEGRIKLYQRNDVKDELWHCAIRMNGHRAPIRRSTNETDFEKAKERAFRIMGELDQRVGQNLPLKKRSFEDISESYLKIVETETKEKRKSKGRSDIITGTLNRYLKPYFGKRDISSITKRDFLEYRAWRQTYWISGPGAERIAEQQKRKPQLISVFHRRRSTGFKSKPKEKKITKPKQAPSQATLKQEWTVLRAVFLHGLDLGVVPTTILPALKHEVAKVKRRPAFTGEEWKRLYWFMRKWVKASKIQRILESRALLREYVLILCNSGIRKGEARELKWRDIGTYTNGERDWVTLQVDGKTGPRTVVCQPGTERYLKRIKKREHHLGPDDYVFCYRDGKPIQEFKGFDRLLELAGLTIDSKGNRHTIYSLRHTYATLRLQHGTNVYWLKKNMGTTVDMIERHSGQTSVLVGAEYETARRWRRRKKPKDEAVKTLATLIADESVLVPDGAVDLTTDDEPDDDAVEAI